MPRARAAPTCISCSTSICRGRPIRSATADTCAWRCTPCFAMPWSAPGFRTSLFPETASGDSPRRGRQLILCSTRPESLHRDPQDLPPKEHPDAPTKKQRDDTQRRNESPPETGRSEMRVEAEEETHGQSNQPVAGDHPDQWGSRVTQSAEHAGADRL